MSKIFFGKKKMIITIGIFLIISLLFISLGSCKFKTIEKIEETREMMGTYVSIIVYSDQETGRNAIEEAFKEIEKIEAMASVYDPESEASFLNENGYIYNPSDEFLNLINTSIDYYNITDGCFDITVQPLLDLWSGGLWKESEEVQAQKIGEILEIIGSDKIIVGDSRIEFESDGMAVTLGGIAKGYAVDKAIEKLKENGIDMGLVNAGGDIYAIGAKPGDEKWSVELESPDSEENGENAEEEPVVAFSVADRAVTTSGGYHRYYDEDKEVHHIMDPRTGYSSNASRSVTIIADNCTRADILATAVFVMGMEDGGLLVESLGNTECYIIGPNGDIYESSGILEYTK
ncbi:MAG: FAD:protein FMN transferase [Actinomycetota bacterium]|nr:FAD:protein FMN transferase [Actinomycetota bacterium]